MLSVRIANPLQLLSIHSLNLLFFQTAISPSDKSFNVNSFTLGNIQYFCVVVFSSENAVFSPPGLGSS